MAEYKNATHNDEPVIECNLGREDLRKLILKQLKNAEPPKALAIHGTWGTGKTSLLMQLYENLGGNFFDRKNGKESDEEKEIDGIRPVWFEAWQYQHEPNILAALLKEIRDQLAWHHKVWKTIEETVVPGALSFLQSIDVTFKNFGLEFGMKGFASKFTDNVKAYQQEQMSMPLESLTQKRLLEDAISKLIGLKFHIKNLIGKEPVLVPHGKAVIFIDDLDRCEPETAFKILETIKVYLNLKNCVFVLGMDMEAVEQIIARYYEKVLGGAKDKDQDQVKLKNLARLYLEKICQDVYHLPIPDHDARQDYFAKLIAGRLEKEVQDAAKVPPLYANILALTKTYKFLPPYPRSIKILANVLISFCSRDGILGYAEKGERELKKLLIFAYLYAFHYEVYQLCYLYSDKEFYNSTFLAFCENPEAFKKKKGGHPLMEGLILPENLTAAEAMKGQLEKELSEGQWARTFPHESLRQVLWIRNMVIDAGGVTDPDLKTLNL